MKKFKYFRWIDPTIGYGIGPALIYVKAKNKEQAKYMLISKAGLNHDPDFIDGDVIEVEEFIQPKPIPIIS